MPDDATAGLIFASDQANHNFARVLGDLRRSHLSINHRLRSICRDATFVAAVAARYPGFVLVANERCGSWYIPSHGDGRGSGKGGSAYFKSTDGHTNQWSFSMRRLNLHLLPLICASSGSETNADSTRGGGCILVDSTRRGKRMPDALSKTVPLWCCVMNRALFGQESDHSRPTADDAQALYTPPGTVSASEHSQMLARVPAFVESLGRLGVLAPDAATWRRQNLPNGKPLRPVWVTPDMPWPDVEGLRDRFNLVLCCTSSHVPDADDTSSLDSASGYPPDYIQGAADDTENWAHGLTPELFWAHSEELLATAEADLPTLIASLVQEESTRTSTAANSPFTKTAITPFLSAGQWVGPPPPPPPPSVCQIVFVRQTTEPDSWFRSQTSLEVGLGKQDKIAGRTLRYALPTICEFVSTYLARPDKDGNGSTKKSVRVLCPTGRDISVGAALALLCFCFDGDGEPRKEERSPTASTIFNKDVIRVRLGRIMAAMPHANPSRATLQSVNSFLMDWRG